MTDSEGEFRHLLFVCPDILWGVSTGSWLAGGISRHDVSAGHTVQRSFILVNAGISSIISSWSRGLGEILMKSSLLLPPRHGEDGGLRFSTLLGGSQHWSQCVVVGSRCVVCPPVPVTSSEAVGGVAEVSCRSRALGAVGTRARHFKHGSVLLAAVQGVVRGSIISVPVDLGVGVIARARAAVIPEFSVANTERIRSSFVVNTTGIVGFLSD